MTDLVAVVALAREDPVTLVADVIQVEEDATRVVAATPVATMGAVAGMFVVVETCVATILAGGADCLLAVVGVEIAQGAGAACVAGLPVVLPVGFAPIPAAIPSRTTSLLARLQARLPTRTTQPAGPETFFKPIRLRSDPIEVGIRIAEIGI